MSVAYFAFDRGATRVLVLDWDKVRKNRASICSEKHGFRNVGGMLLSIMLFQTLGILGNLLDSIQEWYIDTNLFENFKNFVKVCWFLLYY